MIAARAVRAATVTLIGGLVTLTACASERAGSDSNAGPLPTIGFVATVPSTTSDTAATTVAATATQGTTPTTSSPPPPPSEPPTSPPTTTAPPTTTPPLVTRVLDIASFQASYEESGGGIGSANWWSLTPSEPRVQASTGHGPLAVAEAADVWVRLHSTFQPPSSDATLTWDVSWSGYMTSFVGADSSARARVTARVYEIIPGTQGATRGPIVFEQVVADDGVGAALQGVATMRMDGDDYRSAILPQLDPAKTYRVEAELHCSSRVAFSVGATVCAFGDETTSGLTVDDLQLVFENVPG
jgi:hypothetical protein